MPKEPDNRIGDLSKRSEEHAKSLTEIKVEQAGFRTDFNKSMSLLKWGVGIVIPLVLSIGALIYSQNGRLATIEEHSKSTDERVANFEKSINNLSTAASKIAENTQKQPQALNGVLDAVNALKQQLPGLSNGVVSGVRDQNNKFIDTLRNITPLLHPGNVQQLRLTFRNEHLQRTETSGIVLRAPLPNKIAEADSASIHVQSVDIPPEDGSYQAEAKLLEGGAVCQVTIFSSEPDRIKERLSDPGITASLLLTTPYTGVSRISSQRIFAMALPFTTR
jgi:hypothetical protein